jgi:hypothetical protein
MSKVITKNYKTIECLNILSWIESENGFFAKEKLSIRIQWEMKKNLKAFSEVRTNYEEFNKKIQEKYSDDKYSENVTDEDGNTNRVVKKEYLEEFNKERNEIFMTDNDIELHQFSIEDFGDVNISIQDMEFLSIFIIDEDDEEKADEEGE